MESDTQSLTSLLVTGWGVLYSVSLGWSFYNLMDQWPRLIRFGSIWRRNSVGPMMVSSWLLIFIFVGISFSSFVTGAHHFGRSGWQNDKLGFPLIFGVVGLTAFINPFFINRAIWGFALLCFPGEYRTFVSKPENRIYWERRITLEAAQKVFIRTRFCGGCIFGESTLIVLILSWASSGLDLGLFSPRNFWILAPLIALIPFALLAHIPWPDLVHVTYQNLPSALGGELEEAA